MRRRQVKKYESFLQNIQEIFSVKELEEAGGVWQLNECSDYWETLVLGFACHFKGIPLWLFQNMPHFKCLFPKQDQVLFRV